MYGHRHMNIGKCMSLASHEELLYHYLSFLLNKTEYFIRYSIYSIISTLIVFKNYPKIIVHLAIGLGNFSSFLKLSLFLVCNYYI